MLYRVRTIQIAVVFFLCTAAFPRVATADDRPRIAVLELKEQETDLKIHYVQLLTDLARNAALRVLGDRYDVITRENLIQLLKAHGKELEQCEGECETETGQLIGADIVVSGAILMVGSTYKLTLKAHQTAEGKYLGMRTASADDVAELEESVGPTTAALLRSFEESGAVARPFRPSQPQVPTGQNDDWFDDSEVKVTILSEPSGAALMLGKTEAVTPFSGILPPGTYRLTLTKPWYRSISETIDVVPGKAEQTFYRDLKENFGGLTIEVEPHDAEVRIDGGVIGKGRQNVPRVTLGPHTISVRHSQHHQENKELNIQAGETVPLNFKLKPKMGGLYVQARGVGGETLNARVQVDSEEVGTTPWKGKIRMGRHRVTVAGSEEIMIVDVPYQKTADDLVFLIGESPVAAPAAPSSASGNALLRGVGWTMLVGGVAGIATGIGLAIANGEEKTKIEFAKATNASNAMTQEEAFSTMRESNDQQELGRTIGLSGVAALTVGLVMVLTFRDDEEVAANWPVPTVISESVGVGFSGRF